MASQSQTLRIIVKEHCDNSKNKRIYVNKCILNSDRSGVKSYNYNKYKLNTNVQESSDNSYDINSFIVKEAYNYALEFFDNLLSTTSNEYNIS